MARHLLRDYVTPGIGNSSSTFIGSYLATIFMRRVLGYTYVGDTNYPINGVGTMLISTADSTPTSNPTFALGDKAGINLGLNLEFNVSIPSGTRNLTTFGSSDIGRLLVLKSDINSTYNSGCFLITGFDTATNSYSIDFRSGIYLSGATSISSGSNGINLPTATINVISTVGFPTSGTILVVTSGGTQTVTYTGINATQFTGCTGGTGTMNTENSVNSRVSLPLSTLLVNSTAGFPSSGTMFVWSTSGRQTITYTGVTATSFTGCTGGTGNLTGGTTITGHGASPFVTTVNTTIAAGSNGQILPQATINVAATNTASTTVAAGSNNISLPTATVNVASTAGFPTSGNIYITTGFGPQLVNYTGTTGTTFTGCTGGTGTMTTGNTITAGFSATGGIIYVTTSAGVQQVSYTGKTTTTFTGCFGGTGTMSTGGVVYYSPNVPRIESSDSMNWYLYEKDSVAAALLIQGTSNSNTNLQYRGNGSSTTPRIILQSPSLLGWQVRVCHETTNDSGVGTAPISSECALITFAPGFDGDSFGDFAVGGRHLHAPLYLNSNSNNLQGGAPGFGDNRNIPTGTNQMQYRITIVGDDDGYNCSIFGRRPGNAANPYSYFLTYGMCDNEAPPTPPNAQARLYVIGSGSSTNIGNNLNNLSWYPANISAGSTTQGTTVISAVGSYSAPASAYISLLSYATGNAQLASPIFDASAGDTPWFGGVELFAADVGSGYFNTWNGSGASNYGFPPTEIRFLGTIPHIREGRANYPEYSTTHDLIAQHMRRGLWLLWSGPPVVT